VKKRDVPGASMRGCRTQSVDLHFEYDHRSLAEIIDDLTGEIPIPHQEPFGYCIRDFPLDAPDPHHRRQKE
jgi:hypothetical protein